MTTVPVAGAAPLRSNRDFRLLWIGGLLSGLGSQIASLVLPLLVLAQTHSSAMAGLVGTVSGVALLAALLPGGVIADSTERRRLMLGCQLSGIVAAGSLAAAVLAGRAPFLMIVLVGVTGAVLGSLYGPAAGALLRAAVATDQLGAAMAQLQARSAAARLAGPLLGGVLYGVAPVLPLVVEVCGLAVSVACLLAVRARAAPARRGAKAFTRRELTAGLLFIWRRPYLRTTLIVFGVGLNAAFGAVMLAAVASLGTTDPAGRSSGTFAALAAAGSLTGSLLAPRLRVHERPRVTILLCCWVCAGAVPLIALTPNAAAMGALIAPCMLTAGTANVAFATTLLVATPAELTGRVQTAAGFLSMVTQPIGPFAGGLLLDGVGRAMTFAIFGAVLLAGAVIATTARDLRPVRGAAVNGSPSVCVRDYCLRPGCTGSRANHAPGW